jgi:hypothetical protein
MIIRPKLRLHHLYIGRNSMQAITCLTSANVETLDNPNSLLWGRCSCGCQTDGQRRAYIIVVTMDIIINVRLYAWAVVSVEPKGSDCFNAWLAWLHLPLVDPQYTLALLCRPAWWNDRPSHIRAAINTSCCIRTWKCLRVCMHYPMSIIHAYF